MAKNVNENGLLLQTPVQQRRPKTLGIRYSSIKTISKTPYSEIRKSDYSTKKHIVETASPRTPFSASDNIQKASKSTGYLPNHKLSLGRKVLRKKRLQFFDNSDLNTSIEEEKLNYDDISSKIDSSPNQTKKKPRIENKINTESDILNKSGKDIDASYNIELIEKQILGKNFGKKNGAKRSLTLGCLENNNFSKTILNDNNVKESNVSLENNLKSEDISINNEKNQINDTIKNTDSHGDVDSHKNAQFNDKVNEFFEDKDDFPVDIIEDERHLQKVDELKRLISTWKNGFRRALDDLSNKLDPPREKSEILELLNIPEHMIKYI